MVELSVIGKDNKVSKLHFSHKFPKNFALEEGSLLSWRAKFPADSKRGQMVRELEVGQAKVFIDFAEDGSGTITVETDNKEDLFPTVSKALLEARVNRKKKIYVYWSSYYLKKTAREVVYVNEDRFERFHGKIRTEVNLEEFKNYKDYTISYESDNFQDLVRFALEIFLFIEEHSDIDYDSGYIDFFLEEEGVSQETIQLLSLIWKILDHYFGYVRRKQKYAVIKRWRKIIRDNLRKETAFVIKLWGRRQQSA